MGRPLNPSGPSDAKIAIIQAYPDRMDIVDGAHLSSSAGRYMKNALHRVGITPSKCWYDYIIDEYPGRRGLATIEAQDLLTYQRPSLLKRINSLPNLQVILIVGQEVPAEFGISITLANARGYVWDKLRDFNVPLIASYAPGWLFRGKAQEELTFLNDLDKVRLIADEGFTRPHEHFILEPTLGDVKRWRDHLLTNPTRLYVDIEAIGHLNNRDHNDITIIGIGRRDNEQVLVIPFRVKGGGYYWDFKEQEIVQGYVQDILSNNPCVFHNAEYDVKHLSYQGFGPVKIGGDTMLLHHALHPELPHSLDYVTSIYGNLPYWKSTLKKAKNQLEIDNIEFRTYNARDCLAMMQIEDELIQENKDQGTYHIYKEISMGLLEVALEMNNNGLPVDAQKLTAWKSSLRKRNDTLLAEMPELWPIHAGFNWNSNQHIAYLFYGLQPDGYSAKKAKYDEYFQEGNKKKKNTKIFASLEEYVEIFRDTQPLRKLTGLNIKQTEGGNDAADDEMRVRMLEACVNRSNKLDSLVKRRPEHDEEEAELKNMRKVLENLVEYSTNEKLLSTYTKLHIEPDGCCHPGYKIHGTKTGRLSSYSPNGQNLPYAAKKIFVAPKGWVFIQFDFSNLELVVLAWVAKIQHLINVFAEGKNVHDANTEKFLGIDKTFKFWKDWRRAMKMYVFGRNYGGGLRGMYRRMLVEIPGLQMSYEKLVELDEAYYKLQPEYKKFEEETTDEVLRTRTLWSCFGRIRIFLGQAGAIVRQGLNFRIQSPAADIMGFGLIDLLKEYRIKKAQGLKMRLCLSVHDSALLLAPEREILVALKMLKRSMCKTRSIGENEVSFTGEIIIGPSYQLNDDEAVNIDKAIKQYEKIRDEKRRHS